VQIPICTSTTQDGKCWLAFRFTEEIPSLYLLDNNHAKKEIDIHVRDQYATGVSMGSVTTNQRGEAVFLSGQSVVAATQNGTFYSLFEFTLSLFDPRLCFLQSGRYIIIDRKLPIFIIYDFNVDGVLLHESQVPPEVNFDTFHYNIRQNQNGDILITSRERLVILAAEDLSLKYNVPLTGYGVVVPCMNDRGDLLCGHGQTIDLLDSEGQFVRSVCTTQKSREITNIAYSRDGIVWILYHSRGNIARSDEVESLKLEI
jgi:hypothetical protein